MFTVRRAFPKGRLKSYAKTARSRRRVAAACEGCRGRRAAALPQRHPLAAAEGGRISIDNWRSREWVAALKAAGVEYRRIYDMRHTLATWSLAAGVSIFTLARCMGTSVQMIDQTYGHLGRDAEDRDRGLLDAYDNGRGHVVGTNNGANQRGESAKNRVGPGSPRPLPHHRTCGSASGGSLSIPETAVGIGESFQAHGLVQ